MRKMLVLLAVIGCFLAVNHANAAEFGEALGVAVTNVPPGADVAGMGNAWVATPEFSSNNPAVMTTGKDFHGGVQGTYGRINFQNGPSINLYSGTVSGKLPIGVLQLSYSKANSGKHTESASSADGEFGQFVSFFEDSLQFNRLEGFNVQYGLKLKKNLLLEGDELYAGIGYEHSKSRLTMESIVGTPATTFHTVLLSKSRGDSYEAGWLYRPTKKVSLGMYYSYTREKMTEAIADSMAGILLDGSGISKSISNTHQYRLGAGYQILPLTFLTADYQHLDIDGFKKDQVFAGIEQGIIKDFLYLYGGWADSGPTAGLGVYFTHGGLNLAYMHKAFSDLEPFLGKADVYMASAFVNF